MASGFALDDLIIIPGHTGFDQDDISLETYLTPNIKLNIPIISPPMDTITEHKLAISLALMGGLGIIHHNFPTISAQVREVVEVKKFKGSYVTEPIVASPKDVIAKVIDIKKNSGISSIPVTKDGTTHGRLVGMIFDNSYRPQHCNERVGDRMMEPPLLKTLKQGTDLEEANEYMLDNHLGIVPIVDKHKNLVSIVTASDIKKHDNYPSIMEDKQKRLMVGASTGSQRGYKRRIARLYHAGVDVVVIDTSHGDKDYVFEAVRWIKSHRLYGTMDVIAGNIATPEAAERLRDSGADAVKVGCAVGSICTTADATGTGRAQGRAIYQVADYCKKVGLPVIADGGMRGAGDILKALAVGDGYGANCVMSGHIFAGTDEAAGKYILDHKTGARMKAYRGMGSSAAMAVGSQNRFYHRLVPEGIEGAVPLKGPLADYLQQVIQGMKQGMEKCGCRTIGELHTKAVMEINTLAANNQLAVHDVMQIRG